MCNSRRLAKGIFMIGHLVLKALSDAGARFRNPEAAVLAAYGKAAKNAVLFRFPDKGVIDGISMDGLRITDVRPPYPVTILEWDTGKYTVAVVVIHVDRKDGTRELQMVSAVWLRGGPEKDLGSYDRALFVMRDDDFECWMWEMSKSGAWETISGRQNIAETMPVMLFQQAIVWLAVMCCSNVVTEDHKPPKFANRQRIAKKKPPLVTYKTLVIQAPGESCSDNEPQGGTHASPRQHLRRGHIRRLADGRTVWVNSCVVGKAENGAVIKDYAVIGRELA